ncbi:hypothetical protein Hanom_Chr08g00737391 [Helianthus anomalus]
MSKFCMILKLPISHRDNLYLKYRSLTGIRYFIALFPFQDWWVVPVKVAFDQTAWAAVWNSIYFVVVALLRFESPLTIFNELKATFFPMLTAGWKLWPFAHIITYGVVPIEQRLLWVDCVELIWVTILSTLSNEKSEARISDAPADPSTISDFEPSEVPKNRKNERKNRTISPLVVIKMVNPHLLKGVESKCDICIALMSIVLPLRLSYFIFLFW